MAILIAILAVTNLVTLTVLVHQLRSSRRHDDGVDVFEAPRPAGIARHARRLITVEVLNPLELASRRGGRLAGFAGALAPGLTRRVVYDQLLKTLRRELTEKAVHADVRLHTVRALPDRGDARPAVVETQIVDEVAPLDLSEPH
jgi:hypothetical protein